MITTNSLIYLPHDVVALLSVYAFEKRRTEASPIEDIIIDHITDIIIFVHWEGAFLNKFQIG